MVKYLAPITWLWVIIVGALMLTPNGVVCLVCGVLLTKIIGILSVLIGITGFALNRQRIAG